MFLHDIPRAIRDDTLQIPSSLRSHLLAGPLREVTVAYRPRNSWGVREIFITPYPENTWRDLWNLELQLIDQPGQMTRLFRLMESCGVRLLSHVSRATYKNRYHSNYLMLDCTDYNSSEIDGKFDHRQQQGAYRLDGLYYNILIEFLHEVRINSDGSPRLRMFRNVLHLNMAENRGPAGDASAKLDILGKMKLKPDGLQLTAEIKEKCGISADTYSMTSTNLKSHAMYCALLRRGERENIHLVIWFRNDVLKASTILANLGDLHLNIVRSQLSPSPIGNLAQCPTWVSSGDRDIYTLNVFARSSLPMKRDDTVNKLNTEIFADFADAEAFYSRILEPHDSDALNGGEHDSGLERRPRRWFFLP